MTDYVGIIGIIVSVLLALLLLLLGVIGWFVTQRLKQLDILPVIQIDMASLKTSAQHHAEKQDEFCDRLEKVETHVSNTERVAVMEREIKGLEEEVKALRQFRHDAANDLNAFKLKLAVLEAPKLVAGTT